MNHSKIPSISISADVKFSSKRRRLSTSSPMLRDVTNHHVYTKPAIRHISEGSSQQNHRLLNKYVFGDATVIEEVKKRERKVIGDINHFRNAILEIEKESNQIREKQLPDVKYAISKRITLCNEIQKELSQYVSQLDLKEGEIEMLKKNEEMDISNLRLKWSVEIQGLETQLCKEKDDKQLEWEKRLLQVEDLKPDEKVEQEIRQLKAEMHQEEEKWQDLCKLNREKCRQYSTELDEDLEKFKSLKAGPMDALIKEQSNLEAKRQEFDVRHQSLVSNMEACAKDCRELEVEIKHIEQEILNVEERNKPLKEQLDMFLIEYESEDKKTREIQELARKEEVFYNNKFDMMEQEQLRRRRLENSIDEMRGQIRRFAFLTGEFQGCEVNYAKRCIDNTYFFDRMVPSILMNEEEMLFQEYEMYHDMCLGRGINFNLISISNEQEPWKALRTSVLKFLSKKCLPHYRIDLQYVFLSEEMPSQDMLFSQKDTLQNDKEIELKIEKASIMINSCVLSVEGGFDDSPFNALLQETPRVSSGVGIIKFQLKPMIKDSNTESKPVDFYFIEICDSKMISAIDDIETPNQTMKSPINLIFKKLLSNTKSCLWFKLSDKYDYRSLLELSNKISKMKNPKNGRRSL